MNPRFKELTDKVANIMPAGVYNLKYDSGKSGVEFTEDALEKFAELIVKECALTAGLIENRKGKNIGAAILDHFEIPEDTKHIKYSAKYDAYYDEELNEWTEPKCSDPECEFCTNRPLTPL